MSTVPCLVVGFRQDGPGRKAECGCSAVAYGGLADAGHERGGIRQWFAPQHEDVQMRRQGSNGRIGAAIAIDGDMRQLLAAYIRLGPFQAIELAS